MSVDASEARNQYIAVCLITLALVAVAVADHWNWRDLANAGQTVLGFGGGILTGKYLASRNNPADLPPGSTQTDATVTQIPPQSGASS